MIPILLALAAAQAAPQADAATAAEAAAETRYRACAALVRTNAEQALSVAGAWRVEGGGFHARQCLGLAYVGLERWQQAAEVYQDAARDADAGRDPRGADLWVQSGNAWIAAGEPTRAVQAFDSALATEHLSSELRGEAHLDRARALVALDNAAGARTDLDRALELVPADPMAWYLSAELARRAGDLTRARVDIARAMELAPDHPGIALLAGTLAGLAGDMTEAERLYRRVAEGAPDTDAGRQASASLATLREIEVDAPAAQTPAPQPAPQSR